MSYTLEALVAQASWGSGLLGGVAQGAIVARAQKLAAAEGRTVSLRAVQGALYWLEEEGAIAVHRVHGRGKDGAPAAMKCTHTIAECVALTARSGGRRHCGWHHGSRTYELLVRTPKNFAAFASGRFAKWSAHRLAKSPTPPGAEPTKDSASRALGLSSPLKSSNPSPPSSGRVTRAPASAAPTTDAAPTAPKVSFAEPPPPKNEALTAEREAVGKADARNGNGRAMSVKTNVAIPPETEPPKASESGTALAPPRALSPELRAAALVVLATYFRTFVHGRVGDDPMPDELDPIVTMLERGYSPGQLSMAIIAASKSAYNAPLGRHSLEALMKPRVVISLVNRVKVPAVSLPKEPEGEGARAETGDEEHLAHEREEAAKNAKREHRKPLAPSANPSKVTWLTGKTAARGKRPMTTAEFERLRELEAARLEAICDGDERLALELNALHAQLLARVNGEDGDT